MSIETGKLFEVATKKKFRFAFKGLITTEDLWDLSVKDLNVIFKDLNKQVKQTEEESLLDIPTEKDTDLDNMLRIVKYIASIKLAEIENARQAKSRKEKKEKIMSIIASKQDEALENKSVDELMAMLDEDEG